MLTLTEPLGCSSEDKTLLNLLKIKNAYPQDMVMAPSLPVLKKNFYSGLRCEVGCLA